MKAHIGVDAQSRLVHTVIGTAANVSDVTQAGALLRGERWHVAMQPGKRRQLDPSHEWARLLEQAEQLKASVRAKVEHPFHVIKKLFRHKKVRYKAWPRTRRSSSVCSAWPISSSPRGRCWHCMPEVRLERFCRDKRVLIVSAEGV